MLAKRIIPCLDIKDGRVVKGVQFESLIDEGCPVELAKRYNRQNADEIVFLDISATEESRKTMTKTVRSVAKEVFIPLTVGGGISQLRDVAALLDSGADKVAINSAAVKNPNLIKDIARKYGSQCVVVSIDVKKENDSWFVYTRGGKQKTGLNLFNWVKEVIALGAGELLITSIDNDGAQSGFDIELYQNVKNLSVPVIASGGAGNKEHFLEVLNKSNVTGILAASVFHREMILIPELKQYLTANKVRVR